MSWASTSTPLMMKARIAGDMDCGQFDAHGPGHAPGAQFLLDDLQQIVGVLGVHFDVGVAGDAER